MACEDERFQTEILEMLLQFQDNSVGVAYDNYEAAAQIVEETCIQVHFPGGFFISDECEAALRNANQLHDEIWVQEHTWLTINNTLKQARDRYNDCLHEQTAGVPNDD